MKPRATGVRCISAVALDSRGTGGIIRSTASWFLAESLIAGSGLFFWLLAARVVTPEEVGLASGVVSLATMASFLSQFGITQVILRFGGRDAAGTRVIRSGLLALALLSCVVALLVSALAFALNLPTYGLGPPLTVAALMVGGSVGVSVLLGAMSAHASRRDSRAVVGTGVLTAASKLALALPLALFGGGLGLASAWLISLWVSGGASVAWAMRTHERGHRSQEGPGGAGLLRNRLRYALATYAADLVTYTPTHGLLGWLAPILVLARFDAELAGVFYLVWSGAALVNAVPSSVGVAMVTNRDTPPWLRDRRIWILASCVYGAGIWTASAVGPSLLGLLGDHYAADGLGLLILLALTSGLVAVNTTLQALFRVRRAERALVLHGLTIGVATVAALLTVPLGGGLTGIGVAWLLIQLGGVALGLVLEWKFSPGSQSAIG